MNAPGAAHPLRRVGPLLLALTVALVLADSSIVTLALPAILRDFDSSVNAVAWVLVSFNLALALAAVGGARLARGRAQRAFVIALALFMVACIACAIAPSLAALIVARAAQGVLGAVVVAAALELLVASTGRNRAIALWAAAGVLGAALGPALGGFLTEWLSWEAMFALQVPLALLGLLGALAVRKTPTASPASQSDRGAPAGGGGRAGGGAPAGLTLADDRRAGGDPGHWTSGRPALAPLLALGLASAALSAALLLLVLLLIEGWRHAPGAAALTVTVMPFAALVAGGWAQARHGLTPAIAGALLVAGGLAALGLMPGAERYWTLVPQLAIGIGLGLALATLIGASVGEAGASARTPGAAAAALGGPAAWTVAARHAGIVVGLLALTPIVSADLDGVRAPAERAGLARILDAPLALPAKIELARSLGTEVRRAGEQELPDLDAAFGGLDVDAAERPRIAVLREQLEDEVDRAAAQAVRRAFLVAAILALLAAGAAYLGARAVRGASGAPTSNGSTVPRLSVAVPGAAAAAALLVAIYASLGGGGFGPRPSADPCAPRARPANVERTQRAALATLDGTACRLAISREDLLRALVQREQPAGVSDDELVDAFGAGVDRARDERSLGAVEAAALRVGLRAGGLLGILGLVLGE